MSNQEKPVSGLGDYLLAELRAQMEEYKCLSLEFVRVQTSVPEGILEEMESEPEFDSQSESKAEEHKPLNHQRFDTWYGRYGCSADYPAYPPGFFCE